MPTKLWQASKKRKKDIENGNDIDAIYVLKEFSNKLDISI